MLHLPLKRVIPGGPFNSPHLNPLPGCISNRRVKELYQTLIRANNGAFKEGILTQSLRGDDIKMLHSHAESDLPGLKESEVLGALFMNSDALLESDVGESQCASGPAIADNTARKMLENCSSLALACVLKVTSMTWRQFAAAFTLLV